MLSAAGAGSYLLQTSERVVEFLSLGVQCCRLAQSPSRFLVSLELHECHRVAELRFGGTRANIALDFLNVFNSNTVTAFNQSFNDLTIQDYLRPTQILNPRFIRFNVTVDY